MDTPVVRSLMHPFQSIIQAHTGQQLEVTGQQKDLYRAVSPTMQG